MASGLIAPAAIGQEAGPAEDALTARLIETEQRLGARLGATILDTHTGRNWRYRAGERFPLCSTFKVIACGALLARVDAGTEDLSQRVTFPESAVVAYSPVTKGRGEAGMTLAEICEAAITRSDNTAGNILLDRLGGPAGVTTFARALGDTTTRLDRRETDLNEATPGDPRDTTTPEAMAKLMATLVLGKGLSVTSRDRLTNWLLANKTGEAKLRAGLPKDWRIGDKTGGGDHGTMNDVAVVWPPGRQPLIIALYMTQTTASFEDRNRAIADIGRTLAAVVTQP